MRRWGSAVFLSLAVACLGMACGLEDGGTFIGDSTDGSTTGDGTLTDSPTGDDSQPQGDSNTGSDSSVDSGVDTGPGVTWNCVATPVAHCRTDCPLSPFECPMTGACVPDCAGCGGEVCDACNNVDGGAIVSRCEPRDAAAYSECLAGFTRCACGSQGDCPGSNDTCEGNLCFECGESDAATSGATCKVGTHSCKTDPSHIGDCF